MSTTINVQHEDVTVNIDQYDLTLNVQSGGIVPVNIDTVLQAAEDISALRAITTDANGKAIYADNTTASGTVVVGIATTSALTGANVRVQTAGTLSDASWAWSNGLVWLGTNGALTQTAPTNGAYIVPVGRAYNSTTIIVDIDNSIQTV